MISALFLGLLLGAKAQLGVDLNQIPRATTVQLATLDGRVRNALAPVSALTVLVPTALSQPTYGNAIVGTAAATSAPFTSFDWQFGLAAAGATDCIGANAPTTLTGAGTPLSATQVQINTQNWRLTSLEIESTPRKLCYRTVAPGAVMGGTWSDSGFWIGVVVHCNTNTDCGTNLPAVAGLTAQQLAQRAQRTTCCRLAQGSLQTGMTDVGQCINLNVQTCCGSAAVTTVTERCCNSLFHATATYEGNCPCTRPATGTPTAGTIACPAGESCCLFSKYTELAATRTQGSCFNPTKRRCCDTGELYDPGTEQCCSISGKQSVNIPCPCGVDSDCQGSQDNGGLGFRCCRQIWPAPTDLQNCNKYLAFPDGYSRWLNPSDVNAPVALEGFPGLGNSNPNLQKCWGTCYSPAYQTCCNGVTCVAAYDRCCNSTCCNRFTGTCVDAIRSGAPGNIWNTNEWNMHYDQCSVIEQLSPIKSFWIFVLPTYLLLLSALSLALVLVFANKVATRSYNFLERTLIGLSVFIAIFAAATFFAPVYKYGVVMIILALFTIIVAASRIKWLNVVAVIAYVIALLYLFDPFNGNAYFNFASNRLNNGGVDIDTAGVLHATWKMYIETYRNIADPTSPSGTAWPYCTNYYDYFLLDPAIRDTDRYDNPLVKTFGYCSRGWITALLIFEGILLILTLVTFAIVTIALILRLKEDHGYDPIELEVRGAGTAPYAELGY